MRANLTPFEPWRRRLQAGGVIPAIPLALNARRRWDERRQRALLRYYFAAGAHGIAVAVHTTQFAIRNPRIGLFGPVIALAAEEFRRATARAPERILVGGVCGRRTAAVAEAEILRTHGYHAALTSLGALADADETALIQHCRAVGSVLPLFGFYLQPAVGGRQLSYRFWRRLCELEALVAIKIAPFNRYQTHDVLRAVAESGRRDVALYTGNDDHIVLDLLTPFRFGPAGTAPEVRFVGGLLGQWAVWTRRAVELWEGCRRRQTGSGAVPREILRTHVELTDANAAIFDAANNFAGCVPGIHEVLRRQGLLAGTWCLDPEERLSSHQRSEIDRIYRAYPHLHDDDFVRTHRDQWLSG